MGKHGRVAELGGPPRSLSDVGENARTGPVQEKPALVHRRENRKSTMRSGRTIGEARERLETKSERAAARKKDKRKNAARIIVVSLSFVALVIILIILAVNLLGQSREAEQPAEITEQTYTPSIEIIDEEASATSGKITSRMRTYIGTTEADLRALGLTPVKAVLPTGTIREVDFYLDGYSGFIKTTVDRDPATTAEDVERLLRYLASQGITTFEYIDVRLPGKAYWK